MRYEDLFQDFLRERRFLKNISPNTERYYNQSWTAYKTYAPGGLDIEFSKNQLNKWVMAMREAGIKPKSCNTFISAINAFTNWLLESEIIDTRLRIGLLRVPDEPLVIVNDAQLNRLASYRPKTYGEWRTHTILSLLIDTGMRIDEALGSLVEKVDLENSLVTVKGKGSKWRTVPISYEMRKRLWQWMKKRNKNRSPYLFPTSTCTRMEYHNYRRDLQQLCKTIGLTEVRIHPHGFRHYFACNFIRRGGDIYRLSRILGHNSIQTTQIYLRSMNIEVIQEVHRQLSPLSRY
jgi:integrase/recombinase XerD